MRQSGGGRGRGRPQGHYVNRDNSNQNNEQSLYKVCTFFVKNGNCRSGNSCKFSHDVIKIVMSIPAHQKPIKTIAVMNMDAGPKVLTGSSDATVKVWDLGTTKLEAEIKATGNVGHIEIAPGNNVMWSADQPLNAEQTEITCGVVHLCNTTDLSTTPIVRSPELPYTHPKPIRSFITTEAGGENFVISSGGEGSIRLWKFDRAAGVFVHTMLLEGHVREVTCLYLNEMHLWSGSTDRSLRVWNLADGCCLGVLAATGGKVGHSDSVSCLERIPPTHANPEAFMVSGGFDCNVNIWKSTGEHVHTCTHKVAVVCMKVFEDSLGGQPALVVGHIDGSIVIRACAGLQLLVSLDGTANKTVWSLASLGQSCFASGGDDGNLTVYQVLKALKADGS